MQLGRCVVAEGRVIAKSSSSLLLQLLLPAAAQHLLPARVSVARQLFIGGDTRGGTGLRASEGPPDKMVGGSQPPKGDSEALWNSLQPGDPLSVVVLGVQQQQQQRQQEQGFGRALKRGDPSPFELVVQPILNAPVSSGVSSGVPSGVSSGVSAGVSSGVSPLCSFFAQSLQKERPLMTEDELMDRL